MQTADAFYVRGLTATLGRRQVLAGIDLEVARGEFVSIVGQSGCGKSTLLNCLAGFLPYAGELRRPGNVGYVFQSHALYDFMTCRANIALGLGRLPRRERNARVDEYLEIIGLPGYGDKYPWQLSGGESQRVAIARAFAPHCDAILLDEPFSSLDALRREAMMDWLLEFLALRPTTIIFVTHSIDEALLPANRVVIISRGKVGKIVEVKPFPGMLASIGGTSADRSGPDSRPLRSDSFRLTPFFTAKREEIKAGIFND